MKRLISLLFIILLCFAVYLDFTKSHTPLSEFIGKAMNFKIANAGNAGTVKEEYPVVVSNPRTAEDMLKKVYQSGNKDIRNFYIIYRYPDATSEEFMKVSSPDGKSMTVEIRLPEENSSVSDRVLSAFLKNRRFSFKNYRNLEDNIKEVYTKGEDISIQNSSHRVLYSIKMIEKEDDRDKSVKYRILSVYISDAEIFLKLNGLRDEFEHAKDGDVLMTDFYVRGKDKNAQFAVSKDLPKNTDKVPVTRLIIYFDPDLYTRDQAFLFVKSLDMLNEKDTEEVKTFLKSSQKWAPKKSEEMEKLKKKNFSVFASYLKKMDQVTLSFEFYN